MMQAYYSYTQQAVQSINAWAGHETIEGRWIPPQGAQPQKRPTEKPTTGDGLLVFTRNPQPKGPLAVFGYDYFEDHARKAGIARPKLLDYQGLWGAGEEYAYETLNFVDGKRNAQQIRDAVSAEYGPVQLAMVVEYLQALAKIGILAQHQ